VTQPRLAQYVELAREVRETHEGMLDQETGARAWLATGDPQFLATYISGEADVRRAAGDLVRDVRATPALNADVLRMLVAGESWQVWARDAKARVLSTRQRGDGTLTAFLKQGKRLFDSYRVQETLTIEAIQADRSAAIRGQSVALVGTFVSYVVLLGLSWAITVRRRRRLSGRVLAPITDLHETVGRLRAGDLTASASPTEVPELAEIGSALAALARGLASSQAESDARERRLESLASRFESVVTIGREIAGSLSVRYVSDTVTGAAADLLETRAVLWLRTDDQGFEAVRRSWDPHGTPAPGDLVVPAHVARAAAEALPAGDDGHRAYPLVLAGLVTAVVEVATTSVDPDTEQVLAALLSTAAAALESAHLHSAARELADHDGLTRLPNRRRFEVDVDAEWERCRRYGRPLSLVMLDLDHFKRLNDQHGHLLGDEVLRQVAVVVGAALRTTDTAYRYGGEELVVLLRETGLEDAVVVSERIRVAIATLELPAHPEVRVSTSAGVATRTARMSHHTALVAEADAALYEAKRQGRDQVAVSPAVGPRGVPDLEVVGGP
jgi:diguanylate cyclase (GGDEF)-like protein